MNLASTIDLYFGGPGSGCNPEAGVCGRKPKGDAKETTRQMRTIDKEQSRLWKIMDNTPHASQEYKNAEDKWRQLNKQYDELKKSLGEEPKQEVSKSPKDSVKEAVSNFAFSWSEDSTAALKSYKDDKQINEIISNTKLSTPLFRGLSTVSLKKYDEIAGRYKVGATVDLGMGSFSKSNTVAFGHAYDRDSYMDDSNHPRAAGVVLLHVAEGMRGLDISKHSQYSEEKEVVSKGTYKVIGITRTTQKFYGQQVPTTVVKLKQLK